MNIIKLKDNEGNTIISQDNILAVDTYYSSVVGGKPRIFITTKIGKYIYSFDDQDTAEEFNNIISDFMRGNESIVMDCSTRLDESNRKYITSINKKYSLMKVK